MSKWLKLSLALIPVLILGAFMLTLGPSPAQETVTAPPSPAITDTVYTTSLPAIQADSTPIMTATVAPSPTPTPTIVNYTYRVINTYPHDPDAFTQGLLFYPDGTLYEGTGLRQGRSSIRKVALETGQVLQIHNLADQYFGEGIVIFDDKLYQLTWQANLGFIYDKTTFEQLDTFTYPTEGWGLTHNGTALIMSDGTATLYFRDPATFAELRRVQVTAAGQPVVRLNELEYINGDVYANVWQTNFIVIINPNTGHVTGRIDLTGILDTSDLTDPVDVLNGIAYDATTNRLFVTGKLWPQLFEIELVVQ